MLAITEVQIYESLYQLQDSGLDPEFFNVVIRYTINKNVGIDGCIYFGL